MKKNKLQILPVIVFVLFVGFLYFAVNSTEKGTEEEKFVAIQDAVERSAVQCYAIEGFYPPDVKYLEDNYGLIVDREKYIVDYSVFASNIMPDIQIFKKQ